MPIKYNKLFARLAEYGWTTYRIRNEKVNGTRLISNATYTRLKNGEGGIDEKTLARLCWVLECQPGDLLEYEPDGSPYVPPMKNK